MLRPISFTKNDLNFSDLALNSSFYLEYYSANKYNKGAYVPENTGLNHLGLTLKDSLCFDTDYNFSFEILHYVTPNSLPYQTCV